MYISIRSLAARFSAYHPMYFGPEEVFSVTDYAHPNGYPPSGRDEVLLILQNSETSDVAPASAYLVVQDKADGVGSSAVNGRPTLFIYSTDAQTNIFDEIDRILLRLFHEKDLENAQLIEKLRTMASEGYSLESLLRAATNELKNPFIIYDNHYSLIAHSVPVDLNVAAAQNVVKNGYANVEVISKMSANGELDYTFSSHRHPALVNIVNGYQKLTVSIHHQGQYAGLVCFFDYVRPLEESDYIVVELIGKITSLYLQNIRSMDKNWSPWDYLFSMSLKMKRTIDPEALKMLGIRIPHEMQLFVMGAATPSRRLQGDQLKYLQSQLATWMPTCHQYMNDGYLVCLNQASAFDSAGEQRLRMLLEGELHNLQLTCGLSHPFHDISQIHTAYAQAIAAIELHANTQHCNQIYAYKDCIAQHMIFSLAQHQNLDIFLHPAFNRLIQYDQQYKVDYLNFLLIYLHSNCDNALCARLSNIHCNTVKYRLKVIQEICDIDLKNSDERLTLKLASYIYQHLHPEAAEMLSRYKMEKSEE